MIIMITEVLKNWKGEKEDFIEIVYYQNVDILNHLDIERGKDSTF